MLGLLSGEIGIEQRLVAFSPAPQHVARATEVMGDLEHRLDLGGGVRKHLGIGIRRGARGVAGVSEEVRRTPEEPCAHASHVSFDPVHARVEIGSRLGVRAALGRDLRCLFT